MTVQCEDYAKNGGRCARPAKLRVWQTIFPDRHTREEDARSVIRVCGIHVNSRVITDGFQFAEGVRDDPQEMTHCANCGQQVRADAPHKIGDCAAPVLCTCGRVHAQPFMWPGGAS